MADVEPRDGLAIDIRLDCRINEAVRQLQPLE